LAKQEAVFVYQGRKVKHELLCCDQEDGAQRDENLLKGRCKMIFDAFSEFPKAGLTPDERGEYHMGLSEMARFNAYQEQQQRDREFEQRLDRWMTDDWN